MAVKTIYVHTGDMLDIRLINNPELPKNRVEWEYQVAPRHLLIKVAYNSIKYYDPSIYCEFGHVSDKE
jgi:hypothetical protein